MADTLIPGGELETRDDISGKPDAALHEFWKRQNEIAEKEDRKFIENGRLALKRYRDESNSRDTGTSQHRKRTGKQKLNLFWSNVQLLKPAIYSREPKPDVQRRWKQRDPKSRLASQILERSAAYYHDVCGFGETLGKCVDDRLVVGRGIMRLLYIPHFSDDETDSEGAQADAIAATDDAAGEPSEQVQDEEINPKSAETEAPAEGETPPQEEPPSPRVVFEEIRWSYVPWEDYREGPARTWETVPWIRYAVRMNRTALRARFGKAKGDKAQLDSCPKDDKGEDRKDLPDIYKEATVWEVWDRENKEVVWMAPETPGLILDRKDDPLLLPGFYPQPEPIQATMTQDRRSPVADYTMCRDQYRELDELTLRIAALTRSLKVAGLYAAEEKGTISQLLDGGSENKMIPVKNWAQFTVDKGGLEKLILWLPIDTIAKVLLQLYDARDKVKEEISEMTGVGDVMRGMSDPRETSEAQSIKAGFGTLRISKYQADVQRFAREAVRLTCAAIAQHVEAPVLSLISGLPDLVDVPPVSPQPQPPAPQPMPFGAQPGVSPPPAVAAGPGPGNQPPPVPGPPAAAPGAAPSGPPPAPGGLSPAPGAPATPMNGMAPPGPPQPPPDPAQQAYQAQMAQWQQAAQAAQAAQAQNDKAMKDFQGAVELIKTDGMHAFTVDIETDSAIAIDEADDQNQRMTFVKTVLPILQQTMPVIQGNKTLANLIKEIVMIGVRSFKVARSVEASIEEAFDEAGGAPPPGPPPSAQDDLIDAQSKAKEVDSRIQVALINAGVQQQKEQAETAMSAQRLKGDQMESIANLALKARDQDANHEFQRERGEALKVRMMRNL